MTKYRAVALFVALGVLWGGTFPAVEVGLASFPPVLFAAARYDFAGLLLLAYSAVATDRWLPTERADVIVVAASGVFLIAGNSLLFVGQQYTTGGVAAVIYSLVPIFTTGLAWGLLPDERHTTTGVVGVLVGFVGVLVVARPDPSTLLAPGVVGKGLVTLAAASVAFGSVLVRRADSTMPDTAFTAWSMLVGAVILHAGSAFAGESPASVEVTVPGFLALAYIAVLATAAAFLIYFFLLDAYGALETNLVSYLVPVVATLVGWAYLGERVTPWMVFGFGLILAGFVLLKRRELRAEVRRLRSDGANA